MEEKLNNAAETVGEVSFKFKLKDNKFITNTLIILLALVLYYFFFPKWDVIAVNTTQQNNPSVYNTVPQQPAMPGTNMPVISLAPGIVKINKISGRVYAWVGDAGWKPLEKDKYPKQ
ncbi:MAG: hypothetical protein COX96_00755 [Candidatus Omnitrophica bacterium CG_4_10_14_0_2_um_filter_44_9]|nr:MAG: hypothetical protein COY78_08345 [Candidatus Omnitrophica bacterium CG_4_10_14_0_8_um_filter_44_12]PIZ85026.1 MAG: hypothetical protein COX96_00755 [Candidatus Omnitrophica bacterium CG_4_10_14_0_2_um_filter_44_9]